MLVRITNKCLGGCPHCFCDSNPNGKHMNPRTFGDLLSFIHRARPTVLLLSGGEPTLHPDFPEIANHFLDLAPATIVLSNGSFAKDRKALAAVKALMARGIQVQVRTHPAFYPTHEETVRARNFLTEIGCQVFDDKIDGLLRVGRAKNSHPDVPNLPCSCLNPALVARQTPGFRDWIETMEQAGRFCSPHVDPNGTVRAGESGECRAVGNVSNSTEKVFGGLAKHNPRDCNLCNGFDLALGKYPTIKDFF